jgi:hypothetical protein
LPLHVNFPTNKSLLYGGKSKKRANYAQTPGLNSTRGPEGRLGDLYQRAI